MAVCIVACLPWQALARSADPLLPPEHEANLPTDESPAGESDEADVEEALLRPVTLSDVFGDAKPKPFIVSARAEYQFDASIDNAGDFNMARVSGTGGVLFPLGTRAAGAVGASYGYTSYDFEDAPAFGNDEAWGDIQGIHAFLVGQHLLDRNWSVIGGAVFSSVGETGADFQTAFTGGGFVGGGYRASKDLYVQLGVNVASQLEDDVQVLPVFRFHWQIDEHWLFRAGVIETGATDTAGAGLTYRFTPQWSVHGRVGYLSSRFRLDDSGFAPDGVGENSGYRGALSVTWEPNPDLQLGLIGGVTFGGELRAEDDGGSRLFEEDYDAVPFVSARVRWQF